MVWKKALYCRRSSFDGLPDEYLLLMPWYGPRLVQLETRLYIHWMKDFLQKALRFVKSMLIYEKDKFLPFHPLFLLVLPGFFAVVIMTGVSHFPVLKEMYEDGEL